MEYVNLQLCNPDGDKPPLITIGITCFNAESTIERAVNSALNQTWPNLEIVIVDDQSTDNSFYKLENISRRHDNIIIIRHEINSGAAAARNTILDNSNGEFIAFFDDDDESVPERVLTQYKRIISYECESGQRLNACYASGRRLYPNNYWMDINAIGSHPIIPTGETVANYILYNQRIPDIFYGAGTPTCSLMTRIETFKYVGGFNVEFRRAEDIEFAVRLALAGGHFVGCPEKLYTQYATFSDDKSALRNYEAEMRLIEINRDYLEKKNRYDYAKNWFEFRYYHFSGMRGKMIVTFIKTLLQHPLLVTSHFIRSAPKRLLHELRTNRS